jgi:hypothetical protein
MEGEVFLLGHWRNYEELEESLSIEELTATLDAIRKREDRDKRFQAALQGVDLDGASKEDTESGFAKIWQEEVAGIKDLPEPERLKARGIKHRTI